MVVALDMGMGAPRTGPEYRPAGAAREAGGACESSKGPAALLPAGLTVPLRALNAPESALEGLSLAINGPSLPIEGLLSPIEGLISSIEGLLSALEGVILTN
jgi:hypothetical protein